MEGRSYSFLSRLALPALMSLILLAPAIVRADLFEINVTFADGLKGAGSFNTDGTCDPCIAGLGQQLTNFTFTVDDDTFNEADAVTRDLAYERSLNTLIGNGIPGGDARGTRLVSSEPRPERQMSASMTLRTRLKRHLVLQPAVPEPTSLLLLAGVIGWATRRFRKKSAIH